MVKDVSEIKAAHMMTMGTNEVTTIADKNKWSSRGTADPNTRGTNSDTRPECICTEDRSRRDMNAKTDAPGAAPEVVRRTGVIGQFMPKSRCKRRDTTTTTATKTANTTTTTTTTYHCYYDYYDFYK